MQQQDIRPILQAVLLKLTYSIRLLSDPVLPSFSSRRIQRSNCGEMWHDRAQSCVILQLASDRFSKAHRAFPSSHPIQRRVQRASASRTAGLHNVDAIHSRTVLRIQLPFSFAAKHSERYRERDIAEAPVNRGFLAPRSRNSATAYSCAATFRLRMRFAAGSFRITQRSRSCGRKQPVGGCWVQRVRWPWDSACRPVRRRRWFQAVADHR
jgi:hypothetical protein